MNKFLDNYKEWINGNSKSITFIKILRFKLLIIGDILMIFLFISNNALNLSNTLLLVVGSLFLSIVDYFFQKLQNLKKN